MIKELINNNIKTNFISSLFGILLFTPILFSIAEPVEKENIVPPVERDNLEVIEYLKAENKYTESMMKHTEAFQEALYKEMLGRIKETDLSVPEKLDDYYYYTRTEQGKQYRIYCRKKGSLEAKEEIMLNQNVLAKGYDYYDIGVFRISPDHKFLAYSIDTTGSERFTLYIKDLKTDSLFKEKISNIGYSAAWANDNKTIFYTMLDNAKRPYKIYRHTLGTNTEQDEFVYHEKDDAFWLNISRTKSDKYLIIDLASHTTSEVRYLSADAPEGKFKLVHPRQHKMEYIGK
jgi:oligopeptidase B